MGRHGFDATCEMCLQGQLLSPKEYDARVGPRGEFRCDRCIEASGPPPMRALPKPKTARVKRARAPQAVVEVSPCCMVRAGDRAPSFVVKCRDCPLP